MHYSLSRKAVTVTAEGSSTMLCHETPQKGHGEKFQEMTKLKVSLLCILHLILSLCTICNATINVEKILVHTRSFQVKSKITRQGPKTAAPPMPLPDPKNYISTSKGRGCAPPPYNVKGLVCALFLSVFSSRDFA